MTAPRLPWAERLNAIAIHPEMATRDDIARMAAAVSQIQEVAVRFAHLDQLLTDRKWLPDGSVGDILYTLWTVIREFRP